MISRPRARYRGAGGMLAVCLHNIVLLDGRCRVQLEQQQSEKVAEAEKNDKSEPSVIQLMKSKASFLLKFAGCVSVQSRVEVNAVAPVVS